MGAEIRHQVIDDLTAAGGTPTELEIQAEVDARIDVLVDAERDRYIKGPLDRLVEFELRPQLRFDLPPERLAGLEGEHLQTLVGYAGSRGILSRMVRGFGDLEQELTVIRALRVAPPACAADDPVRRRVFSAALQQCDELLTASERVGAASSPLLLFYALSQAGRAIAAARCLDDGLEFQGHGLKAVEDSGDIGRTQVKPASRKDGRDAYGAVSRPHAVSHARHK